MKWLNRREIVVIPVKTGAFFGAVQEGKFLRYAFLEGNGEVWNEEAIISLFQKVKEEGWPAGDMTLVLNDSAWHMERRKLPNMTEEELEETMYWEKDRLFHTNNAVSMGWQVLFHDHSEWDIMAVGAEEEILERWSDGAKQCGWCISRVVLSAAVSSFLAESGLFLMPLRKGAFILAFQDGRFLQWRRVPDGAKGEEELCRFLEKEDPQGILPHFFWPSLDAGEEDKWRCLFMGSSDADDISLFCPMAAAAVRVPENLNVALERYRKKPFWHKDVRSLRILQGATAALLFGAVVQAFLWGGAYQDLHTETVRYDRLASVRESMAEARQEEKEIRIMKEILQDQEKRDTHWQQKLILMADTMPDGIVLRLMAADGEGIRLEGHGDSHKTISDFQRRLQSLWGGTVRMKSSGKQENSPFLSFSLQWKENRKETSL